MSILKKNIFDYLNMKSTEILKLEGTYRKDRHAKREEQENSFKALDSFAQQDIKTISAPISITDERCKKAFEKQAKTLLALHLLQEIDIPQLEQMYLALQRIYQIEEKIKTLDMVEDVELWLKYNKLEVQLISAYNKIAKLFYITPVSRAKLQLDVIAITEKKAEATSLISKLIQAQEG